MSRYKSQGFNNTFKNARKGFNLAVKSEINIRIHVAVATLVVFLALYLKFTAVEFWCLLFAIAQVICAEMLNTAIEFALDSIYHNRYSRMVGMAKDISAGAAQVRAPGLSSAVRQKPSAAGSELPSRRSSGYG